MQHLKNTKMNKNYTLKKSRFLTLLLVLFVSSTYGQTLVHYWNFNNITSIATITTPSQALGGATLNAIIFYLCEEHVL